MFHQERRRFRGKPCPANLVPRVFPLNVGGASHLQGKNPGDEVAAQVAGSLPAKSLTVG